MTSRTISRLASVAAAIIFAAALCGEAFAGAAAPPVSSADARRYFEESAARRDLQVEMPLDVTEPEPSSARMNKIFDWLGKLNIRGLSRENATVLFFCAMGVIAAVVIANARSNMWSFSRARKLLAESENAGTGAVARMETAQAEADDLAGSGSFAEAMHVLLLRSVSEMRRRLDSPIAESLTSREILRQTDLSPEERGVFETIVGSVEISYFGSHRPGEDEYETCRRSFDDLTELLRAGRGRR